MPPVIAPGTKYHYVRTNDTNTYGHQHWCAIGLFEQLWAQLVEECDELNAVQWEWQAADTMLGKCNSAKCDGRTC
jgi:hypothetical protein